MTGGPGALPILLAALAGGAAAMALRELVLSSPAAVRWVEASLEPLRRSQHEGYVPTDGERQRLALVACGVIAAVALWLAGPLEAALLSAAGPGLVAAAIGRRRRRFQRRLERGLPAVAEAVADALSGGRSVRAALADAPASLEGEAGAVFTGLAAELELGRPADAALTDLAERTGSARVGALSMALASGLAAPDLARLLRRHADASVEGDRLLDEARAATAQARFTGLLVVGMPPAALAFGELVRPGLLAGLLAEPVSAGMIVAAVAMQLAGFALIARLARELE